MTTAVRVVARYLHAKKLDLEQWGLDGMVKGQPVTLYHGSTRLFRHFDLQKSRLELVDNYYGGGIFLTPSKRVAEDYAGANRNMGLPPSIVADLKHKNSKAGAFLQDLVEHGDAAWEKLTPETLGVEPKDFSRAVQDHVGGIDPNTIGDVARYVEGSKLTHGSSSENEPINIFNMSTGLPNWIYDEVDEIGLDSKSYRPKVYTVSVTVQNPLITAKDSEARAAGHKGYDSVVFFGRALVSGVPEVAVFNPSRIKIKHIEAV